MCDDRCCSACRYRFLLWGEDERASDQAFQKAEKRLARFLRRFDMDGVHWRSVVREGEWVSEILGAATELQSDLVRLRLRRIVRLDRNAAGSTLRQLARQLSCSLITMRAEGAIRLEFDRQLADVETHFQRGSDLLAHGFPEEAAGELELCVRGNALFLPGWNGLAEAYQRMGDEARARIAGHRTTLAGQPRVAADRGGRPTSASVLAVIRSACFGCVIHPSCLSWSSATTADERWRPCGSRLGGCAVEMINWPTPVLAG